MKTLSKKIVLLGNEGVGKTSLVKRYVHSIFNDEYLTTIGIKISKKIVVVEDVEVNLMIWDIAGNMMNQTLYNNYLQGAHGVLLVADVLRAETYQNIIKERDTHLSVDFGNTHTFVLLNKSDLLVNQPEVNLADFSYDFLTSAKNGDNVEDVFRCLAEKILSTSRL
ncbi:MAG: GTP-binding protein [Crocinitomix sp.]|nr:GTP-binding protein [Crocinitomix sp.]